MSNLLLLGCGPGGSGGGGGGNYTFRGALIKKSADQTAANYSSFTAVAWDAEVSDTDGFHDTVTNNSRITIPSAVNGTYGQLFCALHLAAPTLGLNSLAAAGIYKGGVNTWIGFAGHMGNCGGGFDFSFLTCWSPPILLTTGDYYEAFLICTDTSITVESDNSAFGIVVLE